MNCNFGNNRFGINLPRLIFLSGMIFLNLLFSSMLSSQTAQAKTSQNHKKEKYETLIKNLKDANEAVQFARDAVKSLADSSQFPQILFQLSELEHRRDKLIFEVKMIKYDFELQLLEKGKILTEPEAPLLTYETSLSINTRILEEFPDVFFKSQVQYRNGMILYETGRRDSAKHIFLKLIPQFQENNIKAELLFRVGECFFDEENYDKALATYKQILESWDSPFFAMSLYKIAWCHYRKNDIADAITTFYYLLNDIKLMEKLDSEILGKSQLELRQEVIDYIAIGFSDYGGTAALINFMNTMGESDYKADLLFKLGEINFKGDYYEETIECFEKLISDCPTYKKLPLAASQLFDCYVALGKMDRAVEFRFKFENLCNTGGAWRFQNFTSEDKSLFEKTLNEMDFKIASPVINTADSLFTIELYHHARIKYSKFIKKFPNDPRIDRAQFCIAECSFNQKDYSQAAEDYLKVIDEYKESKFFEDAAYNQIICFDKLMESSSYAASDSISSRENPALKLLINSCKSFLELVPSSKKSPEILLKLAEIYYFQKMYTLSEQYAKPALVLILKNKCAENYKANAINLLAQINFHQKKFESAEKLFSAIISHFPDSTELITKSTKMMSSARFKIGDQYKSNGKNLQAAIHYEKTASQATDPQIAETALFEAALQYEQCNVLLKAAEIFELLPQKFPQSQKVKESIFRASTLRERLGHWQIAAQNYEKLYKLLGASPEGTSALFNAGLTYEKAKDWYAAFLTFNKFIAQVSPDDDRILEAMFKKARSNEQHNPALSAEVLYRPVIQKYIQLTEMGKIADEYYAAQATYQIAEYKNKIFRSCDLTPPFQLNLKRKQQAFNDLLKAYIDVTKFEVAEWTTASFFNIGLAYEEFCSAILNSPTPANLNQEQSDAYWATIEQKWIFPLQKEALKYYETNINLAQKNSIENDWTQKTAHRITQIETTLAKKNMLPASDQFKQTSRSRSQPDKTYRRIL